VKFDTSLHPQRGTGIYFFAGTLLTALFIFYLNVKIADQPPVSVLKSDPKIQLQKNISAKKNQSEQSKKQNIATENLKAEEQTQTKNETEVRKTNGRELGFELDFGAEPPRQIKNFILPEAKSPGSGRVILKFRFSIRPDGSVVKVFPTMKGNPNLELETMNLLRKWRFEKLPKDADQIDQKVEISFRPE
jgi:outer membrane biosynthesis protein TonB